MGTTTGKKWSLPSDVNVTSYDLGILLFGISSMIMLCNMAATGHKWWMSPWNVAALKCAVTVKCTVDAEDLVWKTLKISHLSLF